MEKAGAFTLAIENNKGAGMTSIWLAPQENEAVAGCDYHISNGNESLQLFALTFNKEAEHGSR